MLDEIISIEKIGKRKTLDIEVWHRNAEKNIHPKLGVLLIKC
jgi:hypothetical protein